MKTDMERKVDQLHSQLHYRTVHNIFSGTLLFHPVYAGTLASNGKCVVISSENYTKTTKDAVRQIFQFVKNSTDEVSTNRKATPGGIIFNPYVPVPKLLVYR